MIVSRRLLAVVALLSLAVPALAQDAAKTPYWATVRSEEVNMRVGPGEDYRITWVFKRPLLPLKVLRMKEGWRYVQDPSGAKGWVLGSLLSRKRGGYVQGSSPAEMRESAAGDSKLLWRLAPGVIGELSDCKNGWCGFAVGPRKGFVPQDRIWGAGEP
jgi:SH3-like domain-containing protein